MELIEFGQLTPRRRAELEADETDPFQVGGLALQFRAKTRHVALQADDGTVVAATGMLIAPAQVGERRFDVLGLGGVIVRAGFRGRGLAREIVEAALVKGATLGPPFALLFCRPDRAGLYRRLDFTQVDGDVLVDQPQGNAVMPLRTMRRPLRPQAQWPSGQLVLHSLPF